MTGGVSITYNLQPNGWAGFALNVEEATINVGEFGYCTDALGDLLLAALTIVTGGTFATFSRQRTHGMAYKLGRGVVRTACVGATSNQYQDFPRYER